MKRFKVDFCLDLTLNGLIQAPNEDVVYDALNEDFISDLEAFLKNKGFSVSSSSVHDEDIEEE